MPSATIQPKTPAAAAAILQAIGSAMAAYQAISDQAAAIHHMFTAIVSAGASSLSRQEKSCLS